MTYIRIFLLLGLMGWGGCSSERYWNAKDGVRPKLPAEVSFNKDAGNGNSLFVMLSGEDGKELPFMVDTGAAATILDRSWEAKLGERLKTETLTYGWFGKRTNGIYRSPKLFLGGTELMMGNRVWTEDTSIMPHAERGPVMGVLGMDCLRHYCVQLDFVDRKMRFLDPDHPGGNLGKGVPLAARHGQFFAGENLLGVKGAKTLIDTADYQDGALDARRFKGELKGDVFVSEWKGKRTVRLSRGHFGGQTYTNLMIEDCSRSSDAEMNIIGLRFLARHRVTFDFPKRMMYLERRYPEAQARSAGYDQMMAANEFLLGLKKAGRLPGFAKDEHGDLSSGAPEDKGVYPVTVTVIVRKTGDESMYCYSLVQSVKGGPWILGKAWRGDTGGRVMEEYKVER